LLTHYEILTISKDAPNSVVSAVYNAIKEKYSPEKYEGEKKMQIEKAIQRLERERDMTMDYKQAV
jgi:hypothetical protein